MNVNTNHNLLAFDREINNSKSWLQARIFGACGYPSEALLDRLMQRLVEVSLYPYSLAVSTLRKTSSNCFPVFGTRINCGCAFLETGSGKITITAKQFLSNQLDFFLHWAFCLLAIFAVKKAGGNDFPAVMVFGVGEDSLFVDSNDEQFVSFCRSGPIGPLRNGKRFLVQSASKNLSSCQPDFIYSRNPLIELLRRANMGFLGRLQLLANHFIILFSYELAVFRLPLLSLLGRDVAYSSISFELDRRGFIESIILTISSYTSQPLWVRRLCRAKVHMVWYAQNFKPVVYVADNLESYVPSLRWIRVDTHWVWTNAFAEYLRSLGHDKAIEVVGPIVWYLPEINTPPKNVIEIVVFDISPFSNEVALGGGHITNYNHPDNLFSFVRDVTSLKSGIEKIFHLPVSLRLKTKRGYKTGYDRTYFDYLEKLNSSGSISLGDHLINIYSLISRSHLVIVYPFTSPAYIADYLNVPSIYYDPTNSIMRHDFGDSPSLINFANTPEGLLSASISALSRSFPDEAITH